MHKPFTEEEEEELKLLSDLFSDLDILLIKYVYKQNDRDYKTTQEALAELASHPNKKEAMVMAMIQQESGNTASQAEASKPSGADRPALTSPSAGRAPPSPSFIGIASAASGGLPAAVLEREDSDTAWEFTNLSDTLTHVGEGLTEGISSLASHITGWVADLASAFDAGWGDDEEEEEEGPSHHHHHHTKYEEEEATVGIGGAVGIERPYQRRGAQGAHPTRAGSAGGAGRDDAGSGEESQDYDDEDEEYIKKDD